MPRHVYQTKRLPLLDVTMRMKRASNVQLSEASGVSDRTIQKARKGGPILKHLAECIEQALHDREYNASGCVNNWKHRRKAA